jgi:hypothetical protein
MTHPFSNDTSFAHLKFPQKITLHLLHNQCLLFRRQWRTRQIRYVALEPRRLRLALDRLELFSDNAERLIVVHKWLELDRLAFQPPRRPRGRWCHGRGERTRTFLGSRWMGALSDPLLGVEEAEAGETVVVSLDFVQSRLLVGGYFVFGHDGMFVPVSERTIGRRVCCLRHFNESNQYNAGGEK